MDGEVPVCVTILCWMGYVMLAHSKIGTINAAANVDVYGLCVTHAGARLCKEDCSHLQALQRAAQQSRSLCKSLTPKTIRSHSLKCFC